jgi:hypothetical protein
VILAALAAVVAGWQLWSGPANPLVYRAAERSVRARLPQTAQQLVGLLSGARLVEVEREEARVSWTPPPGPARTVEMLLLHTGGLLNADHTLAWQKRGYRVDRQSAVFGGRCDELTGAQKRFGLVSYYLTADRRLADLGSLQRRLATSRFGARRVEWLVRVEIATDLGCYDRRLHAFAGTLDQRLQNWLGSM